MPRWTVLIFKQQARVISFCCSKRPTFSIYTAHCSWIAVGYWLTASTSRKIIFGNPQLPTLFFIYFFCLLHFFGVLQFCLLTCSCYCGNSWYTVSPLINSRSLLNISQSWGYTCTFLRRSGLPDNTTSTTDIRLERQSLVQSYIWLGYLTVCCSGSLMLLWWEIFESTYDSRALRPKWDWELSMGSI